MSNPKFRTGMIFSTSRILKEALEHHKVIMGTHIKLRKSDLTRLRSYCKGNRGKQHLFARTIKGTRKWQIKSLEAMEFQ